MSSGTTRRDVHVIDVSIAAGASVSAEFVMPRYAAGFIVSKSAAWTTANLGLQVKDAAGTWHTLADQSNAFGTDVNISALTALRSYPMPGFWFAGQSVRLLSHNGSGVAVVQGAVHNIEIQLKS